MELQISYRIATGVESLDTGLAGLAIDGSHLFASTLGGGGVSVWNLLPGGAPQALGQVYASGNIAMAMQGGDDMITGPTGTFLIMGGAAGQGLIGYALAGNALNGSAQTISLQGGSVGRLADVAQGSNGLVALADDDNGRVVIADWQGNMALRLRDTITADAVDVALTDGPGSSSILLVADRAANVVSSHVVNASGQITQLSSMGAAQGLGIGEPTAMEMVDAYGGRYVVVAAAQSQSLSVLGMTPEGELTPLDHVIDTLATRFGQTQAVASVQIGGQMMLVAGGGDDGLSLFTLLPDGRLVHRDTIVHGNDDGLENITDITASHIGDKLVIAATGESASGITIVTADAGTPGQMLSGAGLQSGGAGDDMIIDTGNRGVINGGGGNDVLVAGADGTVMTGGNGADVFVFRGDGGAARVTDFQPVIDQIDISDWTMLRSPERLTVTTETNGATIDYFGDSIRLFSDNGQGLDIDDIFPNGFQGPDHMLFLPDPPAAQNTGSGISGAGQMHLVEGQANAGLIGASMTFRPDGGGAIDVAVDANGGFTLGLAAGTVGELRISRAADVSPGTITAADALSALRLAVGLDLPQGITGPAHYVAADISGDGRVTATDALEMLRLAVGLPATATPEWRFIDPDAMVGTVTASSVPRGVGVDIVAGETPVEIDLTAVLTGDLDRLF